MDFVKKYKEGDKQNLGRYHKTCKYQGKNSIFTPKTKITQRKPCQKGHEKRKNYCGRCYNETVQIHSGKTDCKIHLRVIESINIVLKRDMLRYDNKISLKYFMR